MQRRAHPGLIPVGGSEFDRMGALEVLRQHCAAAYDPEQREHVVALKDVWALAFPTEPFALPSERWKEVGFQGTDPRTDLRGCGYLGLLHLKALLTQQGAGMISIKEDLPSELGDERLPLAIASINCTAMLLSHLQLAPKLTCAFLPGGRLECSADMLQAFLSLGWERIDDGESAAEGAASSSAARPPSSPGAAALAKEAARRMLYDLQAMHARLTVHLARVWARMNLEPSTNLMDFPAALRETYAHMQRALRLTGRAPWKLEMVISHLESDAQTQPLLEGAREAFGPITEVMSDCLVKPAGWALSYGYEAVASALGLVWGMCEPSERPNPALRLLTDRVKRARVSPCACEPCARECPGFSEAAPSPAVTRRGHDKAQ